MSRQANWQPWRGLLQGGSWTTPRGTFDVGCAISDGVAGAITASTYSKLPPTFDWIEGREPNVLSALRGEVLRVAYEYYNYEASPTAASFARRAVVATGHGYQRSILGTRNRASTSAMVNRAR